MKTNQDSQLFGGSAAAAQGNLEAQFEGDTCFRVQILVTDTGDFGSCARGTQFQAAFDDSGRLHRARLLRLGCLEVDPIQCRKELN